MGTRQDSFGGAQSIPIGYSSGGFSSFSSGGRSVGNFGSNSGFSSSGHGRYGFSSGGNSGFGGSGYSNGDIGALGFDSSRSYGPEIQVGGASSFIFADNGFNSGYGGSNGGSSGRIISRGGGSHNTRIY